jgi:site-specific recombinase XerD
MYAAEIRLFLLFVEELGLKDLKQLARRHVEGYLAQLDRDGYADSTRRRKLSVIKSFCTWLAQSRIIAADPTADIIPPRRQWKAPRVLTQDEYRRLLSVVDESRDLALLQLLLQTGIRLAEAHRLNLPDVTLPETVDEQNAGRLQILGRPRDSQTVYLNATACQALAAWLRQRPLIIGEPAVFVSRNTERLSRRQMQRLMTHYVQEAGLPPATVKALRYSFAGHHLLHGTPLKQVRQCLGIRESRSTEAYVEVAESLKAQYMQVNGL